MTVAELAAYLVANLNTYIAARSTTPVPLVALASDQIYTEYQLPVKTVGIFLDPGDETVEDFTMASLLCHLPVAIYVFTQGDTEAQLVLKARGYMRAVIDCIGKHADFVTIESRISFEGVEGRGDIKAAKITAVFEYEEIL